MEIPGVASVENRTSRPTWILEEMVAFVVDRPSVLPLVKGRVAVRFSTVGRSLGYAAGRGRHRFPRWAGRARYAVHVLDPLRPDGWFPSVRICGHATGFGRLSGREYKTLHKAGERRVGRWPLYRVDSWDEEILHTVAHEIRHVVQFDGGRKISEVDCEVWAAEILDEWRAL